MYTRTHVASSDSSYWFLTLILSSLVLYLAFISLLLRHSHVSLATTNILNISPLLTHTPTLNISPPLSSHQHTSHSQALPLLTLTSTSTIIHTGTLTQNKMTVVEGWVAGKYRASLPTSADISAEAAGILCTAISVNSTAVLIKVRQSDS